MITEAARKWRSWESVRDHETGLDSSGTILVVAVLSRRAVLAGGLGGAGALLAAAGGCALVETGALPGKYRLARALGRCGSDPGVPGLTAGPVVTETFASRYRGRDVEMITMFPPGPAARLPVTVVLHGAGGSARSAVQLGYPAFLAQAVTRAGVPPFVMVSVDGGGSTYWHRRAAGDDPLGMIVYEVLPRLARRGHPAASIAIIGWSMGGYGALLLAERLARGTGARGAAARGTGVWGAGVWGAAVPGAAAVVASSPAIFASYAAARAANPGAFDGPADFATSDLARGTALLARLPVMIDCGSDDPFAPQAEALRRRLGEPAGAVSGGCHDAAFWRRRLPAQLAFLGAHLSR